MSFFILVIFEKQCLFSDIVCITDKSSEGDLWAIVQFPNPRLLSWVAGNPGSSYHIGPFILKERPRMLSGADTTQILGVILNLEPNYKIK
ncbi:unnamed protein product [Kuraishia capsulata CBS 1993]|uniref:Uncharacterized protein n=1 Tax=Kuraishia capsulata CBS 1993 TaxID=1382522 RepID=W6MH84_9ASCO|nr:uncharacterized protein KUCA_T00001285001 [Kuraishia capsulata CBS 1993]CDK25316.1 unnamed protein product [Kuraishia capsulata CBS 1993]